MPKEIETWTEGWKGGRNGRQNLFYTTLPATAGGPDMIDLVYSFVHTEKIKYMLFSHLDEPDETKNITFSLCMSCQSAENRKKHATSSSVSKS